jgi:hypothetical protein
MSTLPSFPRSTEFNRAAPDFLSWVETEYREHPASGKRIKTSFASLVLYFGPMAVHNINGGMIEDYKERRLKSRPEEDYMAVQPGHSSEGSVRFAVFSIREEVPVDPAKPGRAGRHTFWEDAVPIHVFSACEELSYFNAGACYQDLGTSACL